MGMGAATDWTEIQLLKAGFSLSPDIPDDFELHISSTRPADDGTNVTEFSGDTYAPQSVAWAAAAATSHSPGDPYYVTTKPTADIVFPTPTVEWWPAGTAMWAYLTDTVPNVLWRWRFTPGPAINASHPLVFSNTGTPTGGSIEIGFSIGNPGGEIGDPDDPPSVDTWNGIDAWMIGALNTLTGAGSYTAPTWYIGMADASDREPDNAFFSPDADPGYARLALGAPVTPTHDGISGRAQTHMAAAKRFRVLSQQDPGAPPNAWGTNMTAIIADNAASGAGTIWFRFGGTNAFPLTGNFFDFNELDIIWKLD